MVFLIYRDYVEIANKIKKEKFTFGGPYIQFQYAKVVMKNIGKRMNVSVNLLSYMYISIKIVMYLEFSQGGSVKEISDYIRQHQPQVCTGCSTEIDRNDKSVEIGFSNCGICETVSFHEQFLIDMVIY